MVFWEDERLGWCKRVISGREDAKTFGLRLWSLAEACGMNQAAEVIFISDAGRWCEQVYRDYLFGIPRIPDWYHLSEHIWEAARVVHADPDKARLWVDSCLARLNERSGIGLLQLIGYLKPRLDFTDYQLFREKGWIIGSGAMESTCKQVVGQRLKGAGRQWSDAGAVAMAELVTIRLNKDWDQLWKSRPMQRAA